MPLRFIVAFFLLSVLFIPVHSHATDRVPQQLPQTATANAPTISIPAGLYTLDELATKLSTPDAPVRAAPHLTQRLGFACFKNRSQAEAIHCVEIAFAVKAQPSPAPNSGLVLVPDADAALRERRWQGRFISFLRSKVGEEIDDRSALLSLSRAQVAQEVNKRFGEQAALAAKNKMGTPSELAYLAALDRYARARKVLETLPSEDDKSAAPFVVFPNKNAAASLISGAVRSGSAFVPARGTPTASYFYATFSHGDDGYILDIQPVTLRSDQKAAFSLKRAEGNIINFLFGRAAPGTDNPVVPLLGSDAATWIRSERDATTAFAGKETARKPFKLNPALPSDAVSAQIWQWCVALDQEAVIEIFPSLDAVQASGIALTELLRFRNDWSARDENGVALFTNRLAFLDRSRSWELDALQLLVQAQILRAATEPKGNSRTAPATGNQLTITTGKGAFPASLLVAFSARVWTNTAFVSWDWPGVAAPRSTYYGYEPKFLDDAAAIGLLWTNVPNAQKEGPPGRTDIPLNTFSPPTLRLLAQWFADTGTLSARPPAFAGYLRQSGHLILMRFSDGRHLQASIEFDELQTPLSQHSPRLMIALDK